MPKFHHRVECKFEPTFRSQAVASMFDVPPTDTLSREWDVDLPIDDKEWQIGFIYGASGSGKTSIAKRLYGDAAYHTGYEWTGKSVLDDFPKSATVKDITQALSSVGFSSPPDWLRPYRYLSNGQQFRAEVARLMLDDENYPEIVIIDEFTSLVDRQVARFSSAAVARYIRASKKKIVCVSCHDDVIEWLNPDWVYEVGSATFADFTGREERRHPPIKIEIQRVVRQTWFKSAFPGHHYLNKDILRSAHCYVGYWEDRPVAFLAVVKFPHQAVKNGWRGHRLVVLPDFQGMRIGVEMADAVAQYYTSVLGLRYFAISTHPAMDAHQRKSPKWMLRRQAGTVGKTTAKGKITGQSVGRATTAYEFIGHIRTEWESDEYRMKMTGETE